MMFALRLFTVRIQSEHDQNIWAYIHQMLQIISFVVDGLRPILILRYPLYSRVLGGQFFFVWRKIFSQIPFTTPHRTLFRLAEKINKLCAQKF